MVKPAKEQYDVSFGKAMKAIVFYIKLWADSRISRCLESAFRPRLNRCPK
jgi:hypothetical protein